MIAPSYRYARPDDAASLHDLIERCYRGDEIAKEWASESAILKGPRTSRAEIAALLADPACRFLVAEDQGRIVGCALLERRGADAYFGMFSIEPRVQEVGLGKSVLARAEQEVRELWGARAMTLVVISLREALIAWYERRGYARTGAIYPFPFGPTTGEVRRDFHLVELRKLLGAPAPGPANDGAAVP
ncbi:MAG TPA: GNAT family N-acetyltransferase [Alphaproteobacteria bacterium]|nr:GNAT family N-acetyltransferase [Alphaproteobacteria bacterium]